MGGWLVVAMGLSWAAPSAECVQARQVLAARATELTTLEFTKAKTLQDALAAGEVDLPVGAGIQINWAAALVADQLARWSRRRRASPRLLSKVDTQLSVAQASNPEASARLRDDWSDIQRACLRPVRGNK